jgi:hypothetical protein
MYDRDDIKVIVPVFVDDITLASKSGKTLDSFVIELEKHFKLRDLGPTSFLLGVAISRDRPNRKLYLLQKQYILNKLEEFNMAEVNQWAHQYFQVRTSLAVLKCSYRLIQRDCGPQFWYKGENWY